MITKEKQTEVQSASPSQVTSDSKQHTNNFTIIWREALVPYLGTRGILVLVGLLAQFYIRSNSGKQGSKRDFLITSLFASLLAVFLIFFVLGLPILA